MQTSEQLCTRKQNTMDEYPKIKNFPLKRRNWQSSNLVIELASCFLFPCWSRVSLVRFIRYRLETAKKSPAPENKSCQAQYRNLLSVVMCARFTFELWILIFLFCSSTIRAASYSNRFDTIFPPFFIHRQISSTCQFYVSTFVQRDYEFSEGNYGSLQASTSQILRDLLDMKSL